MFHARARLIAPAVAAGLLSVHAAALAAEPGQQELVDQIKALQAKVDQLEARQQQKHAGAAAETAAVDTAVVDRTVREVLNDANSRGKFLQQEGFTAGYDRGKFLIQSADGKFVLNPQVQFQFRYVNNTVNGAATGSDNADGFEVRRLKLTLDGNLWSKDFVYKFQWATSRNGGALSLEEAFVQYRLPDDTFGPIGSDFAIKGGQFKEPTLHEEITSAKRQLAVDRSLVNEVLGGGLTDFVQGVALIYAPKDSAFRAEVGYTDGINSDNTNFQDGGGVAAVDAAAPNWGAYARGEYKVMGGWKQYDDFTALGNKEDLLVIGAGLSYTDAGSYALLHTVDVQYETGPIGAYAAYYGVSHEDGASAYDWGALAQAGYLLNDKLELFGRYDYVDIDGTADAYHELTVGVNYYFHSHNSKVSADFVYLPNGAPGNETGIGVLAADDSEYVFRLQYQLLL